jgi:hypothetical protein
LSGVTGTTFAGVTNYATEIQRRSWGAVKHVKYGDNATLDTAYNNRLSPSQYDFKNSAGARLMGATYTYHDDGGCDSLTTCARIASTVYMNTTTPGA